ncbi:MAG: response regulator [Planctomycetota bacterium]|jgi:two-component system chemotaxis response regulator CheY
MNSLIVEDDFTARQLMQIYLSEFGKCFVAVNGKEAVQAVTQALDNGDPYDLIALDIMMPEMDGVEALKVIRNIEKKRGITGLDAVKVIMTTAKGQSQDIFNAFNTGCEAYIIKPVRKQALVDELTKLGLITAQGSRP